MSQSQRNDEGLNPNRAIGGFNVSRIAIPKSNKGINFRVLLCFIPAGNAEKSTNNIAVNKEEEEPFRSVDGGGIDDVGSPEIVPIDSPNFLIDDLHSFRYGGLLLGIPLSVEGTIFSKTIGMRKRYE